MSTGGAGINTSASNTDLSSLKTPYAPAQAPISNILASLGGSPQNSSTENNLYQQAYDQVTQLPNFGPAAAQTAGNIFQTGGDPTGLLRSSAGNLQSVAGEGANGGAGLDPLNTPGMQGVLDTIKNDIGNQVNSQFAGAGRSLSGLNTQNLARGLAQGEAVPLLNQYNQNVSNMMGANQGLGNISQNAMSNLGQGMNFAQAAPGLASAGPLARQAIEQQQRMEPFQFLNQQSNIANQLGGMGGQTIGTGSSQNTGSLLSALSSILGGGANSVASGGAGLLASLFGG